VSYAVCMTTNLTNCPAHFHGTPEQIEANRRSHQFDPTYDRCWNCDCRPWGIAAEWPCGSTVPRVDVDMQAHYAGTAAPWA
jgi:hypothetical protein